MEANKYHALCSNELLKRINSLLDDSFLNSISSNYSSYFEDDNSVNYIWLLISTSLLMSENLYKYDKTYKLISEDTIKLILDKLYMYPLLLPDKNTIIPGLLDDKNNVSSSFLSYIKIDFNEDNYENSKYEKYFLEEDMQFDLMMDDFKETLKKLRKDNSYGSNDSIIEDGFINIRKFIDRTRNALAHSNYEVIDENHIRLYHYNTNTKKLDFNVILETSIIVLIVDELNEIASDKYSYFMNYYNDSTNSILLKDEITDEKIYKYILSFEMFDEDIALKILNEIKNNEKYLTSSIDNKINIINETIYEQIKPSYNIGIILNDYLYCDKNGKIINDELYDKYGVFNYLNSDYFNTAEGNINNYIYAQNKFKFLLLALLNCSILNGYNINEDKEIEIVDFCKMNIDEDIMKEFLLKNSLKATQTIELMENEIEKNKKALRKKSIIIEKKQDLLDKHDIDNDHFNITLPTQIQELKTEISEIISFNDYRSLELKNAKEQGSMYNFEKNISQFIFNHLRNALAHGYVRFPKNINLSNITDMIITFEDYNPHNKKELTFRGNIKLGDLLSIITSKEYINNVFGINITRIDSLIKK